MLLAGPVMGDVMAHHIFHEASVTAVSGYGYGRSQGP